MSAEAGEGSGVTACVITVSDRCAAGERADRSGPIAVDTLRAAGFDCADAVIVPDGADSVQGALRDALAAGVRVIVTTGGTGVSPRDQTPEGTARVITREVPGISEELRRRGAGEKTVAVLSRGIAGVEDACAAVIVNLPGSSAGVSSGMPVVIALAGHVLDQLDGKDHG